MTDKITAKDFAYLNENLELVNNYVQIHPSWFGLFPIGQVVAVVAALYEPISCCGLLFVANDTPQHQHATYGWRHLLEYIDDHYTAPILK